jgi:hypothetical protein
LRIGSAQNESAGHWGPARKFEAEDGRLLPVLLDARGAQAGEAVLVDRILPGEEFLDRQRVPRAGLFKREQAAAHSRDDFGLAPDDPTLGGGRRQVRDRERTSIGPDDVFDPRAVGFGHWNTHKHKLD